METIGRYLIKGKLGEGATSLVYLGEDPESGKEVAIKVIYPHVLKDRERGLMYRHLLLNEASLAGKLQHPSIVQIHEAVLEEDLSYIVMEYVRGGTLEQFCSPENLIPIETLVEIIFKCTRALQYAQRLGITHRDIKPANILLVQPGNISGDIKISDFGAAITPDNDQTQVSAVGSPAYMSPEQVREYPLNHQTDIYSLGVVMYQLLTGRLPFQASSNYNMVYQICNSVPAAAIDLPQRLAVFARRRGAARNAQGPVRTLPELGRVFGRLGAGLSQSALNRTAAHAGYREV